MRKCTSSAFLICSRAWRIFLLATLTITIISGRDPSTTNKELWFITHCGQQSGIIFLFRLFNLSHSPKVRTGHGWTGHFEKGIGFSQEFLIKTYFLRTRYLGFDWSGWIVLIKSEILITTGMARPVSSDKWKAPLSRCFTIPCLK